MGLPHRRRARTVGSPQDNGQPGRIESSSVDRDSLRKSSTTMCSAAHKAMAVSGHRTRNVFVYSIRVEEQTRAALRRTTAYTEQLRADRKVVSLTDRRAK